MKSLWFVFLTLAGTLGWQVAASAEEARQPAATERQAVQGTAANAGDANQPVKEKATKEKKTGKGEKDSDCE